MNSLEKLQQAVEALAEAKHEAQQHLIGCMLNSELKAIHFPGWSDHEISTRYTTAIERATAALKWSSPK